jgi:hypothetical protein
MPRTDVRSGQPHASFCRRGQRIFRQITHTRLAQADLPRELRHFSVAAGSGGGVCSYGMHTRRNENDVDLLCFGNCQREKTT